MAEAVSSGVAGAKVDFSRLKEASARGAGAGVAEGAAAPREGIIDSNPNFDINTKGLSQTATDLLAETIEKNPSTNADDLKAALATASADAADVSQAQTSIQP